MTRSYWKQGLVSFPAIGVSLLPKLMCPACWPAYAGLLSSLGIGFLISATYLLPVTVVFLALSILTLGFRAQSRHGYGPLLLGLLAATIVLVGKFRLDSPIMTYAGIALLIAASVWNAWPRRTFPAAAVRTASTEELNERSVENS